MTIPKKGITIFFGLLTILVSCLVITGWIFDIELLKRIVPGLVSMKFNTALCFGLLGISLTLLLFPQKRPVLLFCVTIVILTAAVTISEYIFDWDAGIDQLLWNTGETRTEYLLPGRPSVPACINFILLSLAILDQKRLRLLFLSWLSLWIVFLSSLFSFFGYMFGLPYFNDLSGLSQMALHSTVLFVILALGVYFTRRAEYLAIAFRKKMIPGFILIMSVVVLLLSVYNKSDQYFITSSKWLQHTNEVLQRSEEAIYDVTIMESSVRAYLLVNDPKFIDSIEHKERSTFLNLAKLQALTADNPSQSSRTARLYSLVTERLAQLHSSIVARKGEEYSRRLPATLITAGVETMSAIRTVISGIQAEEKRLLEKRTADNRYSIRSVRKTIFFFGFTMFAILLVMVLVIVRNITARIRAEEETKRVNDNLEQRVASRTEELMKAEFKFHYTLDNMMEGAQIIDFNWKYVYVNDALLKYSHFKREELVGHTVMECYPGIEQTPVFKVFERCMYDRESIHLENEFSFPDGSTGWFELSYQPVPDGIFILSVDITERKRSEEAVLKLNEDIARREKRFRSIIESSNDLLILADQDIKPFYRSPSAQRITGWTVQEMKEMGGITRLMKPEDVPEFKKTWERCISSPGIPVHFIFSSRHKNGHYLWLEGYLTNMLHDESLHGVVINLQDVSARKHSEEQLMLSERTYRLISSSIPGSVISLLDRDRRYFLVEGDMLEKLGYVKEQLVGKTIKEALSPERYAVVNPLFDRVFGGEIFTMDEERPGYDTVSRFVPLKDEAGEVYAAMVVVFDISELKNAQRSLNELNHELEDRIVKRTEQLASANKELESFSYSVSHDLRAPLRGIDGWSLALQEDYGDRLDEKGHQYLGRVRSETQRMGELIDDMLKLSRVSRVEIRLADVDISELAQIVARRLQEENQDRSLEFVIQKGLHITGDSNLLEIMLTNLLSNACKFTAKVAVATIEFGKIRKDDADVFFIKDNGVGFNVENAKNLFGAFQRMHRQSEFPGSGIGLATVQRILNLHHGSIRAEAEVNKGATFFFTIP